MTDNNKAVSNDRIPSIKEILNMPISDICKQSLKNQKAICLALARDSCISNRALIWAIIQNIRKHEGEIDSTFAFKMNMIAMIEISGFFDDKTQRNKESSA